MGLFSKRKTEDAAKKPKRSRLSNVGRALGAMLAFYVTAEVTAVATDFVAKVDLALHEKKKNKEYDGKHHIYYRVFEPDQDLGYKMKLVSDVQICLANGGCWYLNTDEMGFRNGEWDKESADVVVVGSTFSFGAPFIDESFVGRMHEYGTRVSNFSMLNYSPQQFNAVMVKYPEFFRDKTIIYCLSSEVFKNREVTNLKEYYHLKGWDKYQKEVPNEQDLLKIQEKQPLLERTLAFWIYDQIRTESRLRVPNIILPEGTPVRYLRKETVNPTSETFDRLIANLNEAIELADEYNSHLMVLLFPSKGSVRAIDYEKIADGREQIALEEETYKRIMQDLEGKGVRSVDMTSWLRTFYLRRDWYKLKGGDFSRDLDRNLGREIKEMLGILKY